MTAATCDCCSGSAVRTPQTIENRPSLSRIDYRAGRHGDFLQAMLVSLTDADRPSLAELTTRDTDDFTIALLDSWAVVCDVLTFYTERLANESFLRTALDSVSLQELGKLIGYQLDPGVAAETHLAFAIEHPPAVPNAQSQDPGSSPPVTPSVVTLETGLRVQSIPGPGEQPQTFETVATVEARPEWNSIAATTTVPSTPRLGDTNAWLAGAALDLQPGDVFLLAGTDILNERWDVRILDEIVSDTEADRTEVRWTRPLGSITPSKSPAAHPDAFVLRERINVFGHNAPSWKAMSQDFKDEYAGTPAPEGEWPSFTISEASGNVVDLDGSHPDVVVGSWIVLNKPGYRELWKVGTVTELSRAAFGMSGKVTRLTLTGGENYSYFDDEVRETTVFAVSEPLALAEAPDPSNVGGAQVTVRTDASDMVPGRELIVRGTTMVGEERSEVARMKSVSASGNLWTIVFDADLANMYDRASVVVHGNVAPATHGETVTEILGSGRASEPFQRFSLARSALTYVQSSDPSGSTSTLMVRVNGVAWDESATLYDAGPSERRYAVRVDEQGRRTVGFGDGVKGSRMPTGSQNVVAEYRHGLGTAGNVGAGSLAQLLDRPLGAKGVFNPAAAQGGVDPEDEDAARSTMPLKVRTLGRAVSLLDYADFSRAFTGVSKAHAVVLPLIGGRTIVVTVAFTPGTVSDPTARCGDLETALRMFGDPQVEVKVLPHDERAFRLGMSVGVDATYDTDDVLEAVDAAIVDAFAFDKRQLNQALHQSEITAIAHGVDGVVSVDIDFLYTGSSPILSDRLLPQQSSVTGSGNALPSGLLVIDEDPFDSLGVMS